MYLFIIYLFRHNSFINITEYLFYLHLYSAAENQYSFAFALHSILRFGFSGGPHWSYLAMLVSHIRAYVFVYAAVPRWWAMHGGVPLLTD